MNEVVIKHHKGMDPDTRKRVNEELAQKTDWYKFCRKCGKKIMGTMEQLQKPCECHGTKD